jgi:hypothetical protein
VIHRLTARRTSLQEAVVILLAGLFLCNPVKSSPGSPQEDKVSGAEVQAAREQLVSLKLDFSEDSFVTCAARGDARAVDLFLAAGMTQMPQTGMALLRLCGRLVKGMTRSLEFCLQRA